MAIKRNNTENQKEKKQAVDHEITVTRVKDLPDKNVIMFDMIVNGVTIYGCSYRTLKNKSTGEEFGKIGFPSRKSGDAYYNHVYVGLSPADVECIEKQIEAEL